MQRYKLSDTLENIAHLRLNVGFVLKICYNGSRLLNKNTKNPCSRCGKERIITESHQEAIGSGLVTFTQTACPDPECQIKVLKQIEMDKIKRQQIVPSDKKPGFGNRRNTKPATALH